MYCCSLGQWLLILAFSHLSNGCYKCLKGPRYSISNRPTRAFSNTNKVQQTRGDSILGLSFSSQAKPTSFIHSSLYAFHDEVRFLMIKSIQWYKDALSPVMPPNCRFLPTCSSYAMEAIEMFGPWKGGILTAWRIFRCNPTGGTGYDPPVWPPPDYFAGSTTRKWF